MPKHHRWNIDEENSIIKGINEGLKPSEIKQKYLPLIELSAIQHKYRKIKAGKYAPKGITEHKQVPTTKGNIIIYHLPNKI